MKLWGDGGLCGRLIDSRVYAGCTVDQMLSGKPFIRTFRVVTLVAYEALRSLWCCAFYKWFDDNGHIDTILQYVYQAVEMSVQETNKLTTFN